MALADFRSYITPIGFGWLLFLMRAQPLRFMKAWHSLAPFIVNDPIRNEAHMMLFAEWLLPSCVCVLGLLPLRKRLENPKPLVHLTKIFSFYQL